MSIFLRELKAHRLSLIWWCLGMASLVASGMAKYAAYKTAGQSITGLLAGLPRAVLVIFGMTGFDLAKASGFFGVLYLYIAVMAAVHASLLGANVISKEERDRTSEFLFAKPVTRSSVLTSKLLAGLVNVIVLNLATAVSSYYFVGYFGKGESVNADITLLMVGLLFLQLIFFTVSAAVAGIVKKPKSAPSIATSIMFTTFLVSYLVNFNANLDVLKYLSPFKYFDAATLMTAGRLDPVFVALSVVIVAVAVLGTYRFFGARDLSV